MGMADLRKLTKNQLLHILEGPIGVDEVEHQLKACWEWHDRQPKDVNYGRPCRECDDIKRDLGY